MGHYATVVISDLHLGAGNSRGEDLLRFLDEIDADHLIVNGDVFDRAHLGRLRDADLRVLEALRQFGLDRRLEWLIGNHDPSPRYFRSVLGIDVQEQTVLEPGDGREYLIYHGHGWDEALTWPKWLIDGADGVYRWSQRIDRSHTLAKFLKHRCKVFVRAVDNLRRRAVLEAGARGLDGVVLGHSHMPCDCVIDGIHYLNAGCWTEQPSGFVGVRDGVVRQEAYTPRRRTVVAMPPPNTWRGASLRPCHDAVAAAAAVTVVAVVTATAGCNPRGGAVASLAATAPSGNNGAGEIA